MDKNYLDSLWQRVNKLEGGCWLWTGTKNEHGYGVINLKTDGKWRTHLVHRVTWSSENGDIPSGMGILHRCDTPLCCNPAHLFLGTQTENIADMMAKDRVSRVPRALGEKHGQSKLKAADIPEIRRRAGLGESQVSLGRAFGVDRKIIARILSGELWSHVL